MCLLLSSTFLGCGNFFLFYLIQALAWECQEYLMFHQKKQQFYNYKHITKTHIVMCCWIAIVEFSKVWKWVPQIYICNSQCDTKIIFALCLESTVADYIHVCIIAAQQAPYVMVKPHSYWLILTQRLKSKKFKELQPEKWL